MKSTRSYRSYVLLATSLILASLAGCSSAAPSMAEDDPPPNRQLTAHADFYALLRRVDSLQATMPETMAELDTLADVAVTGHFEAIEDGRTFGGESGDLGAVHTAVARFRVDSAVKGQTGDVVYLELMRTVPTSIESLQKALPTDHEVTLYLMDVSGVAFTDIHGEGKGHPENTPLFQLAHPLGMKVDVAGATYFPLVETQYWPQS